jgi:hypothetical protein
VSLPTERRRAARQWEWEEQTVLTKQLSELLNADYIFWTAVENAPWSRLAGIMRRRRGCRSGVPDILLVCNGKLIAIEVKSLFGRVSPAQREVRAEMVRAGAQWWLCRTATGALTALFRAGVPFKVPWVPPLLEPWEDPVSDPDQVVWHPEVRRWWREDRARWRARAKAKRAALAIEQNVEAERQACETRLRAERPLRSVGDLTISKARPLCGRTMPTAQTQPTSSDLGIKFRQAALPASASSPWTECTSECANERRLWRPGKPHHGLW